MAEAIVRSYVAAMEDHDAQRVLDLFSERGEVVHPVLGKLPATEFYGQLLDLVETDRISIDDIFVSTTHPSSAAVAFQDSWTTFSGDSHSSRMVLLFAFDVEAKIDRLTVVFDTYPIRRSFD